MLPDECGGGSCAYTWLTPDTMVPVVHKAAKGKNATTSYAHEHAGNLQNLPEGTDGLLRPPF